MLGASRLFTYSFSPQRPIDSVSAVSLHGIHPTSLTESFRAGSDCGAVDAVVMEDTCHRVRERERSEVGAQASQVGRRRLVAHSDLDRRSWWMIRVWVGKNGPGSERCHSVHGTDGRD